MPGKRLPGHIRHADELILYSTIVQMLHNRPPHLPLRWRLRYPWLAPYAKNSTHFGTHRGAMATKQNDCWCPMIRDIRSRSVDHLRQVNARKELLDQLLAELALHE